MVRKISISIACIFMISGCGTANYHESVMQTTKKTINEQAYSEIKDGYAESFVKESVEKVEFISILDDKSVSDVLKELEVIDGNYYFLKSSDILIPKSRLKISNIDELNNYISATLDKELVIEKTGMMSVVRVINKSELKKRSIESQPFALQGEITVEELIKLITAQSGYAVSVDRYVENVNNFKSSLVTINSKYLIDALNTIGNSKNVYIDIDYDKEVITLSRYKDVVIELNLPLMNLKTMNETSTKETSGTSSIENSLQMVLYDELDKMVKSIISNDTVSTYHIDKSTGLIYMKTTKSVESAVRSVVKSYEQTFAREAIIEFERIEIILNKSREYGIASMSKTPTGTTATSTTTSSATGVADTFAKEQTVTSSVVEGISRGIAPNGALNYTNQSISSLISVAAKANNEIGRILNYSKNMIVLKNNIPSVQSISQNTDYIEKIETTVSENTVSTEATVNTIKDGTSITAMAKVSRDKIFLNITPNIKKLLRIGEAKVGDSIIQLPQYNDQSYNISREVRLGETAIVGSIIVHDDAKEYQGILPLEGFAIGGSDSKSYVRREIVYVVTLKNIKGF